MANQLFIILAALLAYSSAQLLATAPIDEHDPHPQYSFSYSVSDATTGDHKGHSETRDGDSVQGTYSLIESDGSRRIVDYTADAINGFNAVVHKEAGTIATAPVARAPLAYARAPLAYAHAPLSYGYAPYGYAHAPYGYAHAPYGYAHAPVATTLIH